MSASKRSSSKFTAATVPAKSTLKKERQVADSSNSDAESDIGSDTGSDDEEEEEAGRSSMIRKRQQYDDDSDDSDSEAEAEAESESVAVAVAENGSDQHPAESDNDSEASDDYFIGDLDGDDTSAAAASSGKSSKDKLLSSKDIERAQKTEKKSGVVYMSRVPPFMKPAKVRHLLEKYGQIGRVYLVEEEDKRRKSRVKSGGNRRKQFVEGWIEFKNKKYARAVASMLNNTQMGGKKHGFYHDDLWNLKYLPKFKWRHLSEQLAGEKAAREQRLQSEVSQSRKELDAYVKNVGRAKMLGSMKAKREAKAKSGEEVVPMKDRSRNVWQRDVVVRGNGGTAANGAALDGAPGSKRRKTQGERQDDGAAQKRGSMASVLDRIF
ncbi:RNA-binding ATPase activator esf2 [Kickxella alabastrina]|uniref:RNA-binding ATPase activator esf2 n=1 Tax=Kickxella alabastrina TaxID=61397 RepID=A0ACC1I7V8_9FUNG|nr:RNA-binding ATPase activator esf2 [Kickxella alabastrina]